MKTKRSTPEQNSLRHAAGILATLLLFGISPALAQDGQAAQEEGKQSHGHGSHGHGDHSTAHDSHDGHGHGDHSTAHDKADLHAPGHHHDFSDADRWSAIFDAPERDGWQRPSEVVELMTLEVGMHVADLGAGTGYFLPHLATAVGPGGKVYGLDIEASLVEHMRGRIEEAGMTQAEAKVVPTDSPGLSEDSLDRLLIVNTWHHLDDRPNYARKIGQVLKEGGQLIIVDYTLESETGPPKKHRLSPERVIAELEAGGFQAEVVTENLPRQYVLVARQGDS